MVRLVVVILTALTLMSGATIARAQDEEPCPATEPKAGTAVAMASPDGSPTASPTVTTTASPTGSPTGSPTAAGACAVTVLNFAFDPQHITVAVGTTVTWTNKDEGFRHTATALDPDPGTGQPLFNFDMPNLDDSGSHTFDAPGTFNYRCEEHPGLMTGSVTVK